MVNDTGDTPDAAPDGLCETEAGNGRCTLRAALEETNSVPGANTVRFADGLSGTIALGSALPGIVETLVIAGPGAELLALDAQGGAYRVLTFDSPGNNQTFALSGVTLKNGRGDFGGGLFLGAGDALEISASVIANNAASGGAGGGVYNAGGALTLLNSQVRDNAAGQAGGGGIYNLDGSLTLISSAVLQNEAPGGEGAGIRHSGTGTLTFTGGSLSRNTQAAAGGGLWTGSTAVLTGVRLENNAAGNGGAIFIQSGIVTLVASTAAGNSATNGGGLYNNGGSLLLTNTTLSGNAATQNGGGLFNTAVATLNNVTVAANSASAGGGVHNTVGTVTLKNTLIGGQAGGGDCSGPMQTLGHNLASDSSCGLAAAGDLPGVAPLLAPLAIHGGATPTHRLQPGSPAIDAGNDDGCPVTDQRGLTRPQDGQDDDARAACDIGAVEFTPVTDL